MSTLGQRKLNHRAAIFLAGAVKIQFIPGFMKLKDCQARNICLVKVFSNPIMNTITVLTERTPGETRVPVIPETVKRWTQAGLKVHCECGLGKAIHIDDEAYSEAGAHLFTSPEKVLKETDVLAALHAPDAAALALLPETAILLGNLDPFSNIERVLEWKESGLTSLAMELIPRSTIAQKMDAISSQANLAGYAAVIAAAERSPMIVPMMMTPAGTIKPARVFVIGAGVAGLQAIATAKRLGARVEAFDTRPVVAEQVQSLGAKFLKIDLGETGQTQDGYARALTEEQLAIQREAMAKACAQADIVITTAQVFGRKAPVIVTREMIKGMRPGSVVVDLAVSTGGNVEGSVADEEVDMQGVKIIGFSNFPGLYPVHASQMYSSNLGHFILHFWDKDTQTLQMDAENEIISACTLTRGGEVANALVQQRL